MKLTWFGGTTIRIHIGGAMLVADPDGAPRGVERVELVSGADRVFGLATVDSTLPDADAVAWRPRVLARVVDEEAPAAVLVHRIGEGVVLVDAAGEPPLVLLAGGAAPRLGRWAGQSVVVLFGSSVHLGLDVVASAPRLIALATGEAEVERAIDLLRDRLDGTALVALEAGMALEV